MVTESIAHCELTSPPAVVKSLMTELYARSKCMHAPQLRIPIDNVEPERSSSWGSTSYNRISNGSRFFNFLPFMREEIGITAFVSETDSISESPQVSTHGPDQNAVSTALDTYQVGLYHSERHSNPPPFHKLTQGRKQRIGTVVDIEYRYPWSYHKTYF